MFKLFTSVLIVGLLFVLGTVIFKIMVGIASSYRNDTATPQNNKTDIDAIISELELRIMEAELSAKRGIDEAEDNLKYLKEQLEKARSIQSKLK